MLHVGCLPRSKIIVVSCPYFTIKHSTYKTNCYDGLVWLGFIVLATSRPHFRTNYKLQNKILSSFNISVRFLEILQSQGKKVETKLTFFGLKCYQLSGRKNCSSLELLFFPTDLLIGISGLRHHNSGSFLVWRSSQRDLSSNFP